MSALLEAPPRTREADGWHELRCARCGRLFGRWRLRGTDTADVEHEIVCSRCRALHRETTAGQPWR